MWLCLNDAFFSIVDHPTDKSLVLVRARRQGDLERYFGDVCPVERTPGRDYLFRMNLPRQVVADVVAQQVLKINYRNFKASVKDQKLHDAYFNVWRTMSALQPIPPYARRAQPARAGKPGRVSSPARKKAPAKRGKRPSGQGQLALGA